MWKSKFKEKKNANYSLAGGVAETEENPPKRTTKMRAKRTQLLFIVALVQCRTMKQNVSNEKV